MFLLLLFCVTYVLDALLVAAMKNCTQGQVPQWQEQNQIYNWMIFSQTHSILPNLLMIIFCYNTSSNHSPIYTTIASSILLLVSVQIGIHLDLLSLVPISSKYEKKKPNLGAATPTRFFWGKLLKKKFQKSKVFEPDFS
jgi:high-affinity nickel permease